MSKDNVRFFRPLGVGGRDASRMRKRISRRGLAVLKTGAIANRNVMAMTLAMVALTGCFDSSPSESQLKKIVAAAIEPCSLLSIRDFNKINGYPDRKSVV